MTTQRQVAAPKSKNTAFNKLSPQNIWEWDVWSLWSSAYKRNWIQFQDSALQYAVIKMADCAELFIVSHWRNALPAGLAAKEPYSPGKASWRKETERQIRIATTVNCTFSQHLLNSVKSRPCYMVFSDQALQEKLRLRRSHSHSYSLLSTLL